MNKILITFWIVVLVSIFFFVLKNSEFYTIKDITNETNQLNKNHPYLKYNFESVIVFENGERILRNITGNTEKSSFKVIGGMRISKNYEFTYSFKKKIELGKYVILFFPEYKLIDVPGNIFVGNNYFYKGLFEIPDFFDYYSQDDTIQINEFYNIEKNLEIIPYIKIGFS